MLAVPVPARVVLRWHGTVGGDVDERRRVGRVEPDGHGDPPDDRRGHRVPQHDACALAVTDDQHLFQVGIHGPVGHRLDQLVEDVVERGRRHARRVCTGGPAENGLLIVHTHHVRAPPRQVAVVDRPIRPFVMVPGKRYLGRDQDGLVRRQRHGTEVFRDRVLQPAEVVGAVALGAMHDDQAEPNIGLRLFREWRSVLRVVVRHALARGRSEREQGLLHSARGVAGARPTAERVAADGIAADGSVQLGVASTGTVRVVHGRLFDVVEEAALRRVRSIRDRLQARMLQLRSHLAADRVSDRFPALMPARLALVCLAELLGLPMQGLELPDRVASHH